MEGVEKFIRGQLGESLIVRVDVQRDLDRSGDDILRVRIVYDDSHVELDLAAMLDLPGLLRDFLGDSERVGFPVISYVDHQESNELHAAE